MAVIVLDSSLQYVDPTPRQYWNVSGETPAAPLTVDQEITKKVMSRIWPAKYDRATQRQVPPDVELIRGLHPSNRPGVLTKSTRVYDTIADSYNYHQSLQLSPTALWFQILTEIAGLINSDSEGFRSLFTRSAEKIEIEVPVADPTSLPPEMTVDLLRRHVPIDTDAFIPSFTTDTPRSKEAMVASFLDAVKGYYDYSTYCCGIRSVEIIGTNEDWTFLAEVSDSVRKILTSVHNKHETRLDEWLSKLSERALLLREARNGGDSSFLKDIFSSKRCGSGSDETITGWFVSELFFKNHDGEMGKNVPASLAIVPYKNLETGRKFTAVHGLFDTRVIGDGIDKIIVPEFNSMVFEHNKVKA